MRKTYTLDTNADDETELFPILPGCALTIHHSAAGSSPDGTWTLQVYNEASAAWEDYADASSDFTNPSGSDASGVANFINPPIGKCRVKFTQSSGGAASGATVVVDLQPFAG